jgi:chromosome segregation ATPase
MNRRGNPHTLAQARRRDSLDKRQRTLTALATLQQQGHKITFTAVARAAGVSTWLTYTSGVREHIETAQRQQQEATASPSEPQHTTPAALRTELELARQEIRSLRQDKEHLHGLVQHQLGQQLDTLATQHLGDRLDELTRENRHLEERLQHATEDNLTLHARVAELETDLAAARTSLRRMIRAENTAQ